MQPPEPPASPQAATSRLGGWLRALALLIAVAALDQATKALVRANLGGDERHHLAFGVDLVQVRNRGIAFGLLPDRGTVLTVLTFVALAVLVAYFALHARRRLLWLPTGLLLGGAAGNLIDRARLGAVTDFIDPPLWPAFNLADAAITLGVLALVVVLDVTREEPA